MCQGIFSVVIAGLGRVGAGSERATSPVPRTHLGAVRAEPRLRLTAIVDPDPAARARARANWDLGAEIAEAAVLDALPLPRADIVALCMPPTGRLETVHCALALRPRVLVLEKPMAADSKEAMAIAAASRDAGAALRINFHRRLDPGHRRARAALADRRPTMVVGRYGKGLRNYGSHMIDLLMDWFGPIASVQALGPPGSGKDGNLSFRCRMAAGFDAFVLGLDGLSYDQFDLDIFLSDARLELAAGGAEIRFHRPVDGLHYPGYAHLGAAESLAGPSPVGGFAELYRAIADHLQAGVPLPGCDGAAAAVGLATLEAAMASARQEGRIVPVPRLEG